MSVRRVRINSIEDLEALPEDEWVFAEGGINVPFDYSEYEQKGRPRRLRPQLFIRGLLRRRRSRRGKTPLSKVEDVAERTS